MKHSTLEKLVKESFKSIKTKSKMAEGIVSAPLTNMLWKLNPKVKEWENISSTKEALSFIKSLTNEELNNLYVWRLGFDIPQSEDKKIKNLLDLINNKITEDLSADGFEMMSSKVFRTDIKNILIAAENMMKELTDGGYEVFEIRQFFNQLITKSKITKELSADNFKRMSGLVFTRDIENMIKASESMMKELTKQGSKGSKVSDIHQFINQLIANDI
jgi:hypothetical protein